MTTFDAILNKHVGSAFARQMALADTMDEEDAWSADLSTGTLVLGDKSFSAQILGSHATAQNTWLWAWGNEQANFPALALQAVERIRNFGIEHGISELYERLLALESVDPHKLAMVCTGLEPGTCYYPGSYDGGAAFLIIMNPPAEVLAPVTLERACTVITQVIGNFDLDHSAFVKHFLAQQGFEIFEQGKQIEAKRGAEGGLTIYLNDSGLIDKVTGTIQPRKEKKFLSRW